jgi:hypothetical protein
MGMSRMAIVGECIPQCINRVQEIRPVPSLAAKGVRAAFRWRWGSVDVARIG